MCDKKVSDYSLEKYKILLENTHAIPWEYDCAQDRWVFLAPQVERILGYAPDEWDGIEFWASRIHREDREKAVSYCSSCTARGEDHEFEYRFLKKDGTTAWIHDMVKVVVNSDGSKALTGLMIDVSERVIKDDRLRQSEKRFRSIVDELPQILYYADSSLTVRYGNRAFLEAYGFEPGGASGKLLPDVVGAKAFGKGKHYVEKALAGETVKYTERFEFSTGDTRDVEGILIPDVAPDGKTSGYYAVISDITGHVAMQKKLRETVRWLETAVAASNIGLWEWELNTSQVYFSKEWKSQIGYRKNEITDSLEEWKERVHPGDFPVVWESFSEAIDSVDTEFETEYRFRHKNGSWLWILDRAKTERDKNGRAQRLLGAHIDITERKRAEEKLSHSHRLLNYIISHDRSAIAVHDRELRYIYVSERYLEEYNVKDRDIIGRHHYEVFPDLPQKWREVHQKALAGEISSAEEDPYYRDDGRVDWTRWECRPWYENDGSIGGIIVYTEVITDRKMAEEERLRLREQLNQAQKMESVGRLAGGVAHDFNNMLGVILGRAELAMEQLPQNSPIHQDLTEIYRAARRSAELTKQLLAFARKQTANPVLLDINTTIEGMTKLLQRLIGENISLEWIPGKELWNIKIDPVQVDQILANLAVNARDAIEGTGKLIIRTKNLTLGEDYCRLHTEFIPGQYVLLEVSDTGKGMEKEVYDRLFEPFFTTKKQGEGTGLGLSTIYGIVRQNGGMINVYSEPGHGTVFRIYLPAVFGAGELGRQQAGKASVRGGTETILLAEDEEGIRKLCNTVLENYGYRVITAHNPEEALRLAQEHGTEIRLLLADIVMPIMNGRVLAEKISEAIPGIRVLFMSGYTADIISHHGIIEKEISYLHKPFSPAELAARVRQELDRV